MNDTSLRDGFEFAKTRRSLPMALLMAREAVMERFRPMLNAQNVTEQQWRVLRVLREVDIADASALARMACVLPPSLTRILRALQDRGFVETRRDPSDGRRAKIALTDAGHSFINAVSPQSAAIYAEIENLVGPERITALLDEIEFLYNTLNN
ncbi:homoprotocatechuate degradation operon regulator HpaR [Paracoccus aerodenitrificans]|uniref:homoprotocatechuate degradation operon regulator HpaR n=1 Tax=Paracoccus aerodenitrificans TaxID=3017781 RepID=UPI0022EFD8DF|nr:homoprotocatechuate degradation operon regulator HpaR [Paracoccus aerodenitrificans]WBU63580.1 homoprotocatechuate degradation operon regulator HpaR [Paracoccus aerodenitrificans]